MNYFLKHKTLLIFNHGVHRVKSFDEIIKSYSVNSVYSVVNHSLNQFQSGQNHVDQFDADKGHHYPAQTINEKVISKQGRG